MSDRSKVLIIDDSVDIHRLLKIRLRDQNLEILTASSGDEGLCLAVEKQPDLILLDVDMPEESGFEVLGQLKNNGDTLDIPVIFLSGSDSSTDKVRGFDLGAVDYVTKPFDIAELRARVRSALRTQRLVRMLAQRAHLDGLTGLWNRTHLDQRLVEGVHTAQRYKRPFAFILADIDRFKSINDTYGHPFGDHVLQAFGSVLSDTVRASDIACRYGGEEFGIILPDTAVNDAGIVAERIRMRFEGLVWDGQDNLKLTASLGVTDMHTAPSPDPEGIIAAADKALYQAKQSGRNRVVPAGAGTTIRVQRESA